MKISETLQKSSPLIPKREMSKTEYMKLVDANTELVDKMNDLQKRIDKAINILELSSQNKGICTRPETDTIQSALLILKGSDKE